MSSNPDPKIGRGAKDESFVFPPSVRNFVGGLVSSAQNLLDAKKPGQALNRPQRIVAQLAAVSFAVLTWSNQELQGWFVSFDKANEILLTFEIESALAFFNFESYNRMVTTAQVICQAALARINKDFLTSVEGKRGRDSILSTLSEILRGVLIREIYSVSLTVLQVASAVSLKEIKADSSEYEPALEQNDKLYLDQAKVTLLENVKNLGEGFVKGFKFNAEQAIAFQMLLEIPFILPTSQEAVAFFESFDFEKSDPLKNGFFLRCTILSAILKNMTQSNSNLALGASLVAAFSSQKPSEAKVASFAVEGMTPDQQKSATETAAEISGFRQERLKEQSNLVVKSKSPRKGPKKFSKTGIDPEQEALRSSVEGFAAQTQGIATAMARTDLGYFAGRGVVPDKFGPITGAKCNSEVDKLQSINLQVTGKDKVSRAALYERSVETKLARGKFLTKAEAWASNKGSSLTDVDLVSEAADYLAAPRREFLLKAVRWRLFGDLQKDILTLVPTSIFGKPSFLTDRQRRILLSAITPVDAIAFTI